MHAQGGKFDLKVKFQCNLLVFLDRLLSLNWLCMNWTCMKFHLLDLIGLLFYYNELDSNWLEWYH